MHRARSRGGRRQHHPRRCHAGDEAAPLESARETVSAFERAPAAGGRAVSARYWWVLALFCAGCSAPAGESVDPEDRGGELAIDEPEEILEPAAPLPARAGRVVAV